MINRIKFSHHYPKLWVQGSGTLVHVGKIHRRSLTSKMIDYDTTYYDGHVWGKYKLPNDWLLHLTFIGEDMIPFCTLRPYNSGKYEYYESKIGEYFKIEIG